MNEEIEGTVRDLTRSAEGVVKTELGIVFVLGVLPGERVRVSGIHKQGGNQRADRARIVDRSAQRVDPPCPIAGQCGGCPLMIATPALQANFKRDLVQRALQELPGGAGLDLAWIAAPQALAYRRRARLSWAVSSRGVRIGYHAARSDQIADARTCAVLHPALDGALAAIRKSGASLLAGEGEIHLALGEDEKPAAALRSQDPQPPELYRALEALVAGGAFAGIALRAGGASVDATWGQPREQRRGADGLALRAPVTSFSQAHDSINHALVERVVAYARPAERSVLELFAGSGNFTVALAREAKTLVAIEGDPDAADACRENLRARGLSATVRSDDAETYRPNQRPDVVVLDPPRAGAPGVARMLSKLRVPEIVYVSCDPPTLARDLEFLAAAGYAIEAATALDMFPQTAHVETVVRMTQRA